MYMSVTELTFQLDRSELKAEAWNTAREEMGESEGTDSRLTEGRLGGGTHWIAWW